MVTARQMGNMWDPKLFILARMAMNFTMVTTHESVEMMVTGQARLHFAEDVSHDVVLDYMIL